MGNLEIGFMEMGNVIIIFQFMEGGSLMGGQHRQELICQNGVPVYILGQEGRRREITLGLIQKFKFEPHPYKGPHNGADVSLEKLVRSPRFVPTVLLIRSEIWLIKFFKESFKEEGKWLDIGSSNTMAQYLALWVTRREADHTEGDLNDIHLVGEYDLITCLEVLEHLMNPLRLLREIRGVLARDGKLILSTPWRQDGPTEYHMQEWDEGRLKALIKAAGLKIVHYEKISVRNYRGIRPILRTLFKRHCIHLMVCCLEDPVSL